MTKINSVFLKQGFTLYKNVISEERITLIREELKNYFSDKTHNYIYTKDFLKSYEVSKVPFLKEVHDCICDTFSKYKLIPIFSLTKNLHSPVWHRDSQSAGKNSSHLYEDDYLVSKCGIYLQDDNLEWGGGLEVIPGSHKCGPFGYKPFWRKKYGSRFKISNLQMKVQKIRDDYLLKKVRLNLKAGDLLVFHGNLLHRASQPLNRLNQDYTLSNVPFKFLKFMYQWEISPSNRHLPQYISHQKNRMRFLKPEVQPFISEAIENKFPESYPESLQKVISRNEIEIVNLN